MAAAGAGAGAGALKQFLAEVTVIQKRDSVWTKDEQIERLLKPGSKYLNLNPFEVLQLPPTATETEIKKAFRKLSILVHPDKNRNNIERAKQAFDAVNEAYQTIKDEAKMARVWEIFEEAKGTLDQELVEKRRAAKKATGKAAIPEDDKAAYNEAFRKRSCKLFADNEIRKKILQEKMQEDKKRQREEEEAETERKKARQEAEDAWENGRDKRMDSWRDFSGGGKKKKSKKKKKAIGLHKPPKLKTEQRKP